MITLKFNENEEEKELIQFLKEGDGDFELPKYFTIPKGERSMSHRARMLMLAGIEALKEKHPKQSQEKIIKNINNSKQEDIPKSWV